ncbi:ZN462 protein, partial [Panurus biarmicus]|nr:ZN462 protein [Panurus biarmicus]
MEVLQCDGCDFHAPSYEDLKAHIQDVHTAFLQPTDVSEENPSQLRSGSMNASNQTETEFSFLKDEFTTADEIAGQNTTQMGTGSCYSQSQSFYGQHMAPNAKAINKFFQCKFCVRYFRSKNLLIDHTRKVHGAQAGGSSVGSHTAGSLNYNIMMHEGFGKVFSCQFCTYKSPGRARIIKHQKMYHRNNAKESLTPITASAVSELTSASVPVQEPCKELPEEVVERSILEPMVKPLTKSRGNFCCEWCSYQTPRRERWCDHMMKKHRSMVKILSSLREEQDRTSVPDMQSVQNASPNSTYSSMNMTICDMLNADVSNVRSSTSNSLIRPNSSISSKFSSVSYCQMKSKLPHNLDIVNLSDRSHYGVADMTNSADLETSSMLNDSSSDEELNEVNSESGLNSVDNQTSGISAEQLMGSDGNKLLETKGIPFRRYMNRFQCPFCPFLTMHRRSISRHIENIHLSGKTTVYKCGECPFTCKSSLKLGAHRQCHAGTISDWDTVNPQSENIVSSLNDNRVSYERGNINGRKSAGMMETVQQQQQQLPQPHSQHPYKCKMCNYSTTTLKGPGVHQQPKHSFCDNLPKYDGLPSNIPQENEADGLTSVSTVKRSQTSVLGLSSKNDFVAMVTQKVSNDCPLDLSPVKKRTRIDEIASNLQRKINQNKQKEFDVNNVEDYEEEEEDEVEIEVELDREEEAKPMVKVSSSYAPQQMWGRETNDSQKDVNFRNMHPNYNSANGAEIELTLSEDEEDYFSSINMKNQQSPNASVLESQPNINDPDQDNENVEINDSGRCYYCKHCDFSNKSVRSVSTHYQRMHPYIKFSFKYILDPNDHSAVYRCLECYIDYTNFEDLQQHYGEHHPGAMNVLNSDHCDLIYHCHFCSYTSPNVRSLMPHYQRMHPTVKINNTMIFSSYVVEQQEGQNSESQTLREILNSAPKTMATSTPVAHGTIVPASFNKSATKTFSFEYENQKAPLVSSVVVYDCDVCSFASPNMHSVLVHYQKKHPEEKAGYHCEWCIYSHTEPCGLFVHYQRRHPEHYVDYTYMTTKLWAGPDPSPPTLVMPIEAKTYKCRDCIFEASSIWDITNHYQAFHPWTTNGDESVLLEIIKEKDAAKKIGTQLDEVRVRINSENQVLSQMDQDVEDPSLSHEKTIQLTSANAAISSTPYQCSVCQSEYNNLHGLLTHYGKKHPGMKVKAADFAQDININPGAVYKCRHCPYINTRIHGVLTHYQKRHPSVKVTAEDFVHDVEQSNDIAQNDIEERNRIFKQGYGAYRCKLCPYTHGTLEKLKIHYEKYHDQPEFDVFAKSPPKLSASVEPDMVTEIKASPEIAADSVGEISIPAPHFSSSHLVSHTVFRCQLCKYFCSTRKGIARHYRIKHNNVRAQPEGRNNLFKCALCSYTNPIRKGLAAHYQKRHDIDAYYTHCLAASRTVSNKPNKVIILSPPKEDTPQLSEELRRAVEKKKCSFCSFQSFSKKGIVSHYMKRHPGVFPKKQCASKLGGYFTAMYADEHEKSTPVEERNNFEKFEVKSKAQENEWLPFRCIKCFKLSFDTAELLCMHYMDHHSKNLKRDFTILGSGTCSHNAVYQCKYCDTKLHSMAELTSHLNSHNEEFQKRAKRQERRKQLLSKQKYADGAFTDFKQERAFGHLEDASNPKERKVVGYKCKFCVEVHPTLRAICNHLRKHVQYGNVSSVSLTIKGLLSHERGHLALAMFTREDKYSCQYCSFVSAFRH